ncbi:hypothetical protein [Streptomyces sp. NPDC029041]|uniref:hypothetical protein n=1 Tax=Streptomyces sp. NPDC029041 TaxID=3155727 RepID=UPI00340F1463
MIVVTDVRPVCRLVFAAFVLSPHRMLQRFGLGLAVAGPTPAEGGTRTADRRLTV